MSKTNSINTTHLLIEPFSEKYLTDRYVSWLNTPEVVRYSEQRHLTHTLESCKAYMESFNGTPHFFWAISARNDPLGHIGNINSYIDTFNRVADIGILIGERLVWGKGYGREAFKAICKYLLKEKKIRKITTGTLSVNIPMLQLMKSIGMVDDGVRRRHYLLDGREIDIIYAAIFAEQWKNGDIVL